MAIEYVGEHLLPGQLGYFFVILAFVAALVSSISYFFAAKEIELAPKNSWINLGRITFNIHTIGIYGIGATLFYIIYSHFFEYNYAFSHSNKEMPLRYIMSCFWEGQEGSFWLWAFWQSILGTILIRTAKNMEAEVMTVVASVQVFLASMLLGVIIFDVRIGSSPFTLLRENPEMANMPFIKIPTYLEKLNGRGLNPLLQNYWMTIHPPTLFLGFASTLVPFAYAVAALWKKDFTSWQKTVLPWTFFSVIILGTGILMGGAWAYEALSFGGFWAWDPVENASLVPWLTLVAGAHILLVNKNTATGIFSVFSFLIITFILVLYSTFLTRSGILGDSSVHAFTDLGMSGQLLIYLLAYLFLGIILIAVRFKHFPKATKEEELWSREFWMFMGSLVLIIAAFQITVTTSIPVINKVFGSKLAPPTKPIDHYNSWQIPLATIICLFIGFGHYLKFKNTEFKLFLKSLYPSLIIAALITIAYSLVAKEKNAFYLILMFAATYAVVTNAEYYARVLKFKAKNSGSSIAHVGFGLIMVGALVSQSQQKIISKNESGSDLTGLQKDLSNGENTLLYMKDTVKLGDYYVVYSQKEKIGVDTYYNIDYFEKEGNTYTKAFTLRPIVQTNPRMGAIAEPSTQHFLGKDVYTHISYAILDEPKGDEDYREVLRSNLKSGDTIFTKNSIIIYEGINTAVDKAALKLFDTDVAVGAKLKVLTMDNKSTYIEPLFVIRDNYAIPLEEQTDNGNVKITFKKINPETKTIDLVIKERNNAQKEFVVLKAVVFPAINILWIGCFIMIIGTVLSIIKRIKQIKN